MENQACKGSDIKATREGEDNPKLDQMDRGNNEATREGEDTPKLDLEDKGDTKATRKGEDAAKLDLEDRGDSEPNENRYKRPVITKEEKEQVAEARIQDKATETRGAGLGGVKKEGAAEGATRSTTEARRGGR